jgi:excisionase family DNA binding protein
MSTPPRRGSGSDEPAPPAISVEPAPPAISDLSPAPATPRPRPPDQALSDVRFLTVAEVASVMRVSKMTVYRMVHSGELPAVRVGRSFRVPERAVHDYLRAAFIEAG